MLHFFSGWFVRTVQQREWGENEEKIKKIKSEMLHFFNGWFVRTVQ